LCSVVRTHYLGQKRRDNDPAPAVTADQDPMFRDYHQPNKEKRMVVILPEGAYGDWLTAGADQSRDFLVPFPSSKLVATPMT
ncbi:hypothetical protein CTI14_44170, partial [Methylobacterium radiotolerans]